MSESVIIFGKTKSLVGILTPSTELPADSDPLPGIILLNAGLIHRIGPNRIYVKIARLLANRGHAVLRFDLSGVGDSKPREDHLPLAESIVEDVKAAMDVLGQETGAERFILMGHCSGAIRSLLMAGQDPRVVGAVFMNPTGGASAWSDYDRKRKLANYYTNYYSREAVFDPQRWSKLLTGQADYLSITRTMFKTIVWSKLSAAYFRLKNGTVQNYDDVPDLTQQVQGVIDSLYDLARREVPLLFVYSEGSTGLEFFEAAMGDVINELRQAGWIDQEIVPQADHLFTLLESQQNLFDIIENWMQQRWPTLAPTPEVISVQN